MAALLIFLCYDVEVKRIDRSATLPVKQPALDELFIGAGCCLTSYALRSRRD
jgi:hypothetical protein